MFIDQLLKKTSHLLLIHLFFNGFFLHHTRIQWPIHRRRLHLFYRWAPLRRSTLRSLDRRPKPRQYRLPLCLSPRPLNHLTPRSRIPTLSSINLMTSRCLSFYCMYFLNSIMFFARLDSATSFIRGLISIGKQRGYELDHFVFGAILTKGRSH